MPAASKITRTRPAVAGCMLTPTTTQKMLCIASAGAAALQQFIPVYDARLISWPAADYLTANIARTAYAARLPEIKDNIKTKEKNCTMQFLAWIMDIMK